jgi:rhodanese-related sulfurtransferase
MELPDFCEIYPAHGAGSLCGRAIGAKRSSTIGYERHCNYALICGSGQRSSLGASVLKQKGLHHLFNVAGGIMGYQAAMKLAPCKLCELPHGPRI